MKKKNDLSQYKLVRNSIRPGDVVMFWGAGPLSQLIRLFAAGPSHSAIVRQGSHAEDVKIIESTIERGRNGVQTNLLGETLADYGTGSCAVCLPLSEAIRRQIDWQAFYAFCGSAEDQVKYGVLDLFEFLVREIPILGVRVAQGEDQKAMVCSAWVTALLTKCGVLRNINWTKVRPEDLVEMKLYREPLTLLGKPPLSKRFNTI